MIFEILLGLLALLVLYYNCYKYLAHWRYTAKYPGPVSFPIVGNAFQMGLKPTDHMKSVLRWCETYKNKIFRLYFGVIPYFVLTDPKDVEVVLSSTTLLKKTDVYEYLKPWLGEGLLTSDGTKWHKHRKMITPSFHFSILQDFLEIMNKGSTKFITKLIEKEAKGDIFDIQSMIHCLSFDIICETAMGVEMNSLDDPNTEIVRAYNDICYTMQERFFSPFKRLDLLYSLFPSCNLQKNSIKYVKSFMEDVIEKRRNILQESLSSKHNGIDENVGAFKEKRAFLDKLLTATIDNVPLTNDEIAEEVSTFAFEGHDTTSSGISFAILLLSRHPNIQEKVFQEQYELFGNDATRAPTYQDIQSMKYLEMFIKEAQRIFPSVPIIGRRTEKEVNINGHIIPNNSGVIVFIMGMGFNKDIFKDPLKFDPERFNSERERKNPYEYTPFSAGPRNCIGQKFAMLEMKSTLSSIVRNFHILPSDDSLISSGNYVREVKYLFEDNVRMHPHDPVLASVLTLQAANGIYVRIKRRNYS